MPSMPNVDATMPSSLSNASGKIRSSVPSLNKRLVAAILGAVLLGPAGLLVAYLGFVVWAYSNRA